MNHFFESSFWISENYKVLVAPEYPDSHLKVAICIYVYGIPGTFDVCTTRRRDEVEGDGFDVTVRGTFIDWMSAVLQFSNEMKQIRLRGKKEI